MRILNWLLVLAGVSANASADAATVVAAGYSSPTSITVAPGQIVTFFVSGIGASLTAPVRANTPSLPASLAGISATLEQSFTYTAPLVAVEPIATCPYTTTPPGCGSYTAVTVQIPFELRGNCPGSNTGDTYGNAKVSFAENGTVVASVDSIYPACNNVHILRTCDFALANHTVSCAPVVTHADGSMVTSAAPAQPGEEVVFYAVGLGEISAVGPGETNFNGVTGQAPSSPIRVPTAIGYDFRPNAGPSQPQFQVGYGLVPAISPVFSGMTPGSVGLYQINIIIPVPPKGVPACLVTTVPTTVLPYATSNLTVNIGAQGGFDGVGICVQPSS